MALPTSKIKRISSSTALITQATLGSVTALMPVIEISTLLTLLTPPMDDPISSHLLPNCCASQTLKSIYKARSSLLDS